MVKIKFIENKELDELLCLWYEYHKIVNPKVTKLNLVKYLIQILDRRSSVAIGLYKEDKLIGFTLGYEISQGLFYWEGIYVQPNYRLYTYKLINYSEAILKENGYNFWITEANTKFGRNLLNKIASKLTNKTYIKELKWEV